MEITFRPRNVIAGNASFLVSLPKAWAISHGLKPGDKVYPVSDNDGRLILLTEEQIEVVEDVQ